MESRTVKVGCIESISLKDIRVGDGEAAARAVGRGHAEGATARERHPLPARLARRPALAAPPAHRLLCAAPLLFSLTHTPPTPTL